MIISFVEIGLPEWAGWVAWLIIALIAIVYFRTGILQKLTSGQKDLLNVRDESIKELEKKATKTDYELSQLEVKNATLEQQIEVLEKDKLNLIRENHTLMQVSITDLKTVKENVSIIAELKDKLSKYE